MKKIPLTKGQFALVDDEDYDYLAQFKWCFHDGYAVGHVPGTWNKVRSMVSLIMKAKSKQFIDHINMNTLDNRRENLRLVSKAENMMNRPKQANNTSGYKGVSLSKRLAKREGNKMWQANIQVKNNPIWLGVYLTAKEAAIAYNEAAQKYHGEFAKLNQLA